MSDSPLPPGWCSMSLDTVSDVVRGITFPTDAKHKAPAPGHIACLRTTNVQREVEWDDLWHIPEEYVARDDQYVRPLDILISTANSFELVGKVSLLRDLPQRATLGAFISLIRPHAEFDAKFVYYQMSTSGVASRLRGVASTTTNISNISSAKLRRLDVLIAPKPEQIRIVAKIEELFSDLDAGVAALERVRANLKRYRAAVLKAAVEGRLTEEWRKRHPTTESAAKLLERILAERRAKWEQDQLRKFKEAGKTPPKGWKEKYEEPSPMRVRPLGKLPREWCWAALGQTCSVERGKFQHRPRNEPRFFGGPYPFVQIGDLPREGGQILGHQQTLNDDGLSISRQFRAGTILVAIVGATIGNTGVLAFDACAPDSLVAVEGPSDAVTRFADLFLRDQKLTLRAQAAASGGQPNINLGLLQPLPIPLPPLAEQAEIVAEVDRRLSVADAAEAQVEHALQRASRLRQAILKRAFEGKLVPQDPTDELAGALLKEGPSHVRAPQANRVRVRRRRSAGARTQ